VTEIPLFAEIDWSALIVNSLIYTGSFALLVQIFYYLFFYSRVAFYKKKEKAENPPEEIKQFPVSVVICARNESLNLRKYLPAILEQKYPEFEVVVVNDSSEDDSATILAQMKLLYPNLYVTTIPFDKKFFHAKKLALTVGIKAAKYDWVLLTDADCQVAGANWLATMQQNFTEKANFVLGYGGFFRGKGFVNSLIRFDAFTIALQYLSFGLAKIPYMGVGRNLAYRKSMFFENKGFSDHYSLPSGDDDLFVNKLARGKNTLVELSPESFTYTMPKATFAKWVLQKTRHVSTSKFYKKRHKFLLFLEPFTRILFFATITALLLINVYPEIILSCFSFRLIIQMLIFAKAAKKLNVKGLVCWVSFFDIIFPFVYVYLFFKRKFAKNKSSWS
jgi:poly-beta-1,6-N-acetyl-D-glucosamine synthase